MRTLLLPRPWPDDYIIRRFVYEASGQFIYASTVLKFVGDASDFCDPRDQLRILASPGPHRASAFTDLDKLYAAILSAYPRPESMKRVLGGIRLGASRKTIQEFLGVEPGEFQFVMRALSSLIKVYQTTYSEEYRVLESTFGSPLVEEKISFCHLSFEQFLDNESRSGKFAIDPYAISTKILYAILKHGTDIFQDKPEAGQTIAR